MTAKKPTPFKKWYDANKDEFNAQRQERYRTDPDYKETQIAARLAKRPPKPDGIIFLKDAYKEVGVTKNRIFIWKSEGLVPPFPQFLGKSYVYPHQIELLKHIKESRLRGKKTPEQIQAHRDQLKAYIFENWDNGRKDDDTDTVSDGSGDVPGGTV